MLRNIKHCGVICNEFLINNKCFRRIELQGIKCQYQYRLLTSDKGGKNTVDHCKKPDSISSSTDGRPRSDTAPDVPGSCKTASGTKLSSSSSRMDHIHRTNCDWEEENKKKNFRRNFLLISGLILCVLGSIPLYRKYNPRLDDSRKKSSDEGEKKKSKRPVVVVKDPPHSSQIPDRVPYLLIGGGTASFSAFRAIKSKEPKAKVLVVGNEPYYPYMRPPLSKEMFYIQDRNVAKKLRFKQWNGTERSLFYEPDDFYLPCDSFNQAENGGVAVARGWTVKRIDATKRIAFLEDGRQIHYEKCLIATGAKPKNHPAFEDLDASITEKVTLYRNVFDYEELEEIIEDGAESIVIVGGSFLGSELACALARRGEGKRKKLKVTQIMKESGNMGKILPEYLSKWTTHKVRKEGVAVIANTRVEDVDLKDSKLVLTLSNGNTVTADHVVLALGVSPNTDLAKESNLETDKELGGFLVNSELEARSNLYVAGDCACFYDVKLGRRRVEHHDHAVVSGRLAGENMTGAGKPYWHQSMFWSDLGPDVGYEAIGVIDASLSTVGVYAKVTEKDEPRSVNTADSDGMRSSTEEMAGENGGGKKESEASEGHEENGSEESKESSDESEGEGDGKGEEGEKVSASGDKKKTDEEYGKGVIFYLREGTVVGIVLWNVFNRMNVARQVLSEDKRYEDLNEVAKLFNIHKD